MSLSIKEDAYQTARKMMELVEMLNEDGIVDDTLMDEVFEAMENLQINI